MHLGAPREPSGEAGAAWWRGTLILLLAGPWLPFRLPGADDPAAFPASATGLEMVALYEQAAAATRQVCEDYRRIRSMQLAMLRDIPFSEALESVQSVMPVAAPINKEILRRAIRDPSLLKDHEMEVLRVQKDVEDMVALVAKLLLEIEQIQSEWGYAFVHIPDPTLEDIVEQELFDPEAEPPPPEPPPAAEPERQQALTEMARQDDDQRAKDLTPFMAVPMPRPEDLQIQDRVEEKLDFSPARDNRPQGQAAVMSMDPAKTILARRVTGEGDMKEWLFIDTWHVIGPFPNPSRANISRKFPPETVIDLDAVYAGKGGAEVKWVWQQTGEPEVVPHNVEEYAIWYAYTELYFDRPCELWVAIGSDDRGDVWLGEEPIWVSSDLLKGWRPDEGFRKVRFRAGRNRVLFRLENGWIHSALSFAIRSAAP